MSDLQKRLDRLEKALAPGDSLVLVWDWPARPGDPPSEPTPPKRRESKPVWPWERPGDEPGSFAQNL